MTELAFVTLKDPARTHALYIRGLALISNTDQRRKLENAYADLTVLSTMGTQQKGDLQLIGIKIKQEGDRMQYSHLKN